MTGLRMIVAHGSRNAAIAAMLLLGSTGVMIGALPADEPASADAGQPSELDQRLLDSLKMDLLKDLPATDQPSRPPRGEDDSPPLANKDRTQGQPLRQLDGEDIGQEAANPLKSIGRRMRRAEQMLAQKDTAEPTQRVQREVLEDLQKLIEQLEQQCQSCRQSGQAKPSAKPSGKPGQASRAGSGENEGSTKPSPDSTDRVGTSQLNDNDLAQMNQMMKRVWGHLPARIREQMQSSIAEEFLPKYERLIGQYYLRLAE